MLYKAFKTFRRSFRAMVGEAWSFIYILPKIIGANERKHWNIRTNIKTPPDSTSFQKSNQWVPSPGSNIEFNALSETISYLFEPFFPTLDCWTKRYIKCKIIKPILSWAMLTGPRIRIRKVPGVKIYWIRKGVMIEDKDLDLWISFNSNI